MFSIAELRSYVVKAEPLYNHSVRGSQQSDIRVAGRGCAWPGRDATPSLDTFIHLFTIRCVLCGVLLICVFVSSANLYRQMSYLTSADKDGLSVLSVASPFCKQYTPCSQMLFDVRNVFASAIYRYPCRTLFSTQL